MAHSSSLYPLVLSLILGFLACPLAWAQPEPDGPASARTAPLRVGVAGSEPFVIDRGTEVSGLSIEVWREASRTVPVQQGPPQVYPSAEAVIAAVERGEIDVAIGPLTITRARAERVAFTQPWMHAGIGIAARESLGLWSMLGSFFSRAFLVGVGVLLTVLFAVGALLWVAERHKNDNIPSQAIPGIGNSMWLAIVTMTTVGYGDIAPVTRSGRLIASVWMLASMVTASSLTAGIATVLTLTQLHVSSIRTPSDMSDQQVGVVRGTTSAGFVRRHGGIAVEFEDLTAAIKAAESGDVSAVAHDRPSLSFALRQRGTADLTLSDSAWEPLGYGFAFALGDARKRDIDVNLLGLHELHAIDNLAEEWL
ncbi:MAG: ABC transporter substrate-binding protein [Deltaproteobacteria bacterium]|nr:MAG: ABC transporter substrate-binding protein [Deltaproteobacteria bacterium]